MNQKDKTANRLGYGPPNPTLRANREWLAANRQNYQGQWVAVYNGELLGTDTTLASLLIKVPNDGTILYTQA